MPNACSKLKPCCADALTASGPTSTAASLGANSATGCGKTCPISWRAAVYVRHNPNVMFLLPTAAVGVDTDGRYFLEVAWLCWAVGIA